MLEKTRGIVFKLTDYSESSVIAQIYTEKYGLQSYLINGVKKPRAKIKLNMLQALHLLDMVVYYKPSGNIQRVAELKNNPLLQNIPYNIVKSSVALFINEVLYRSVKQNADDERLFKFLFNAIELLDKTEQNVSNFHLYFLLQLSRYLGFYPDQSGERKNSYFDLMNGNFVGGMTGNVFTLSEEHTLYFTQLLNSTFENYHLVKIPSRERKHLLEKILVYYQIHLEGFGSVKSHQILEEVLG